MSENNDITHLHVQRKLKPKIEDVIPLIVDNDKQKDALILSAWLRENKMSPGWSGVHNAWDAKCKGKVICKISLVESGYYGENTKCSWLVSPYLEHIDKYEQEIIDENLQNYVLDNIIYCMQASKMERPAGSLKMNHYGLNYPCNIWGCAPGKTISVLGHKIENKCQNMNRRFYWFTDPDTATLDAIKRLIELEREARRSNHS